MVLSWYLCSRLSGEGDKKVQVAGARTGHYIDRYPGRGLCFGCVGAVPLHVAQLAIARDGDKVELYSVMLPLCEA